MEVDAAQYAAISMEMSFTKSFLNVFENGNDYLDKPPFLFWISATSFLLFDISNFTYKLPSVLFAVLGLYSTYRFSKIYYDDKTSYLSALILGTSQALFLITNDIRTDTILMSSIIFSVWQMAEYLKSGRFRNLLFLSLGVAVGMMTKGPLILVVLAAAFGYDLLVNKQWKSIFKVEWIFLLVFVAILLLPMLWGLYTQFDLHPEKTAYGIESPSGLKFFFWTQSFGRITGENAFKNDTSFFYFFHTILWDFQPWIFFFIPAFFKRIKEAIVSVFSKMKPQKEQITVAGFFFIFIALSLSSYKLPHYIFSIFPFASIITANYMTGLSKKMSLKFSNLQFVILHLFWVAIGIILIFVFPEKTIFKLLLFGIGYLIFILTFIKLKDRHERLYIPTVITALFFNLIMAIHFYPNLLFYQSSTQAGRYIADNNIDIYTYNVRHKALSFYAKKLIQPYNLNEIKNAERGKFIYTDSQGLDSINQSRSFEIIKTYDYFKSTQLNLSFLNQSKRDSQLKNIFILKLK